MDIKKWGSALAALALLAAYNGAQPELYAMRTNSDIVKGTRNKTERYALSFEWLDRAVGRGSGSAAFAKETKLDFGVLSSMMLAGLASGFRSQVANLLWMKSDEYFHNGESQRTLPIMEAVVTLDPNFVDAWRMTGWHWAYNVYAELPDRPQFAVPGPGQPALLKKMTQAEIERRTLARRREQTKAVDIGLDYLRRGANFNPDTYKLWFDQAWTRSEKAGIVDERTFALYQEARKQKDARDITSEQMIDGKAQKIVTQGMDINGHMLAHAFETKPDIPRALRTWREIMLEKPSSSDAKAPQVTNADINGLEKVAQYWRLYGTHYVEIVNFYRSSDVVVRAQIKRLVPDVEAMDEAQKARERTQIGHPTPTGAFVTLAARYMPTWNLMQAGKTDEAIRSIIGVMNADTRYHLQGLPALARVLELRGDSANAAQAVLEDSRQVEKSVTQEIGLHFLAVLYERRAAQSSANEKRKYQQLAYETWYRARIRAALDFYALRNTYRFEDEMGFKPPTQLIKQLNKLRDTSGASLAPPPAP